MLIEQSSDLIKTVQSVSLPSGSCVDAATLINQQILVVSSDTLSLYQRLEAIGDELGNGLIRSVAIPSQHHLQSADGHFIQTHKAGYVGLTNDRVLLIGLNSVQMFASREDALRNQHEIIQLKLGD